LNAATLETHSEAGPAPAEDRPCDDSRPPVRNVLDVPIHAMRLTEVLDVIDAAIAGRRRLLIGVVNAAKIVAMRKDTMLRDSVLGADLVLADGMAVVWASRLLGQPLPERVAGIDLMFGMLERGSAGLRATLGGTGAASSNGQNGRGHAAAGSSIAAAGPWIAAAGSSSAAAGEPVPPGRGGDGLTRRRSPHAARGYRVYCLGATEEVSKLITERIARDYPGIVLAGRHHGYFNDAAEPQIVEAIRASNADILFVAMSPPKKEIFLARWFDRLDVPVCHGVGGAFDVFAGKTKRAPARWQKLGLEWLYRVVQEPRRMWKRYLVTNAVFCWMLAATCCGSRRYRMASST